MELGFQIAIVSGISDCLSCTSDSKARNPDSKRKKFPHFGFSYTWPKKRNYVIKVSNDSSFIRLTIVTPLRLVLKRV